MKLILRETVENLGEPGDLVDVARGFGRNYLLPKGLAVVATSANERLIETLKAQRVEREEAAKAAAEAFAESLSGVSVNVKRKVSEGDQLYGSVTAADVAAALAEEGFEIGKDQVRLEHAIKSLGVYAVPLHLPYGVETSIKLWVVKDESE
ncbi:MAG TPA: 50S ribosomal protein L9 [Acidobacteriota bacterium]